MGLQAKALMFVYKESSEGRGVARGLRLGKFESPCSQTIKRCLPLLSASLGLFEWRV
jgi:hypothetical protein